MQRINVKRVETKPGKPGVPGILVIIHDDKDAKFSAFSNKVPDLDKVVAGDVISADIQIDGKFANIISFEVIEHSQASPAVQPAANPSSTTKEDWAEKDRVERRSIERQVSVKVAAEYRGMASVEELLQNAEAIYQWISGESPSPKKPEPSTTSTEHDWEKMGKDRDEQEAAQPKTQKPKRDPDTIKNNIDLQKALFDDYGLQPVQQMAELNIKNWMEIKNWPAAYRQVAATRT